MNYWPRYAGDWKRKTGHLSLAEKGAYGEMLDHYYATEKPLPAALHAIYRIAGAVTPEEKAACDNVLERFFKKEQDGYHNKRADEAIKDWQSYSGKQSEKAKKSWTSRKARGGNGAWWTSHEGIDEKGRELGISAKPGESYPEYKSRLFDTINAERGQEQ